MENKDIKKIAQAALVLHRVKIMYKKNMQNLVSYNKLLKPV